MDENIRISTKMSLKFVPKYPINNVPALVQIMAWRRPGDKPLSEPMMVRSLTHIWVTRPQWVNTLTNEERGEIFRKSYIQMHFRQCNWIGVAFDNRIIGHHCFRWWHGTEKVNMSFYTWITGDQVSDAYGVSLARWIVWDKNILPFKYSHVPL